MYVANIQQLFKQNQDGKIFSNWVLFLRLRADTAIENVIRAKHEEIESALREQNISYAEITTNVGKNYLYKLFKCHDKRHPLFLVFNKFPSDCNIKDHCMLIEWGAWGNTELLRSNLLEFANFFSNEEFRKGIKIAHNRGTWRIILRLLPKVLQAGISIITAVL